MAKPAKLARAKPAARTTSAPAGDKDTVTITVLDQQGNAMVADPSWTLVATSGDTTVLTVDTPSGLTYGEKFVKAGTTTVHDVVTFADGTTLSVDDSVSVTGVPGSLVATHSLPVGP